VDGWVVSRRFVAAARFRVPELPPAVVERQRLIEPFRSGAEPVAVVVGSPGAGKTAVLTGWVGQHAGPTAWLSCDPTDADPVRFWSALAMAIDRCVDGAGEEIIKRLDEEGSESVDLAARLAEACSFAPDLAVVLDDFHHAGPAPQALSAFVGALPVGVRLVVGSRRDPSIPIGRLRVRGQLLELRDADLRFTPNEAGELFARLGCDVGAEDVARLVDLTEGWAAGLHLAALSLSAHADVTEFVQAFASSDRGVADFLMNEVIDAQAPDVGEFLMQTSILESLGGDLCERVTGRTDSGELLQSLHRAHLFVIALDHRSGWYRYHHLFAAFLRARLRATSVERFRQAQLAASAAHADQGDLMSAVRHAMAANDTETAFRHLHKLTVARLDVESRQEAIDTARAWLREFGASHGPKEPSAVIECCLMLIALGAPEDVEAWLRRVEQFSLQPGDEAMLTVVRGVRALHHGDPETAMALVAAGQAMLGTDAPKHSWISQSSITTCQSLLVIGDSAGLAREINDARQAGLPSPLVDSVRFPGYLAWGELTAGELGDAARHADEAIAAARRAGLDESNLSWCVPRLTRAALFRERDRADEGAHELAIAREIAESAGRPPTIFLAALESARYALALGRPEEVQDHLDAARASMPAPTPIVLDQIARLEARIAVDHGDAGADRYVAALLPGPDQTLLNCRRVLADRDATKAVLLLDTLAESTLTRRQQVEHGVLAARAQAVGDVSAAFGPLQVAVRLAAEVGLVRLLVDEGPEVHHLLDALPADAGLDAFVDRVLDGARRRPAPARRVGGAKLIEPISDREQDVLRFLASRLTYGEISRHLYISVNTLKSHVKAIYRKLEVSGRDKAVERARQLGLL
jgi:LuxR family transcriptional regulator, maltose regulon positive regulatory protein